MAAANVSFLNHLPPVKKLLKYSYGRKLSHETCNLSAELIQQFSYGCCGLNGCDETGVMFATKASNLFVEALPSDEPEEDGKA